MNEIFTSAEQRQFLSFENNLIVLDCRIVLVTNLANQFRKFRKISKNMV